MAIDIFTQLECFGPAVAPGNMPFKYHTEVFTSLYEFLVSCSLELLASNYGYGCGAVGTGMDTWDGVNRCRGGAFAAFRVPCAALGAGGFYVLWIGFVGRGNDGVFSECYCNNDDGGNNPIFPCVYGNNNNTNAGVFLQMAYATDQYGNFVNPWAGTFYYPLFVLGTTYWEGERVKGSDNHVYISIVTGAAGNTGNDPVTDGGVHWTDVTDAYVVVPALGACKRGKTRGGVVWEASATGASTLHVLPRSNNSGGVNTATKHASLNLACDGCDDIQGRWHLWFSDEGSFRWAVNIEDVTGHRNQFWDGVFCPWTQYPGMIVAPYRMVLAGYYCNFSAYNDYSLVSAVVGSATPAEPGDGGCANSYGVRDVVLSTLPGVSVYPCKNYATPQDVEARVELYSTEADSYGALGYIDSPMIRVTFGMGSCFLNAALDRICLHTTLTDARWKTTAPWNPVLGVATGTTRLGTRATLSGVV